MKILFDTHYILWALIGSKRITDDIRNIIENPQNTIYYSVVSPWEINIKHNAKPDKMLLDAKTFIEACQNAGYKELSIKASHVAELATLKQNANTPPHKDPFDRMLLAQAKNEGMIFISEDQKFDYYDESCIFRR